MTKIKINEIEYIVDDAVAEEMKQLIHEHIVYGEIITLFTNMIEKNYLLMGEIRKDSLTVGKRAAKMLSELKDRK
ncbi:MAG: hypothetical protein HOG49_43375 [Candidatus Scalindua sp.]|jgi:hypothetical protein|nr:hypothetical protein [Candidatus Scalindua sp.]